MPSPFLKP